MKDKLFKLACKVLGYNANDYQPAADYKINFISNKEQIIAELKEVEAEVDNYVKIAKVAANTRKQLMKETTSNAMKEIAVAADKAIDASTVYLKKYENHKYKNKEIYSLMLSVRHNGQYVLAIAEQFITKAAKEAKEAELQSK